MAQTMIVGNEAVEQLLTELKAEITKAAGAYGLPYMHVDTDGMLLKAVAYDFDNVAYSIVDGKLKATYVI